MIYQGDVVMIFALYITAKSFFFLNKIGYFYRRTNKIITNNLINNLRLKAIFINLKLVYEYYKKNKYERDISNIILRNADFKILNNINIITKIVNNNELIIYYELLNKYINCIFITNENKKLLKYIKKLIEIKIKKSHKKIF